MQRDRAPKSTRIAQLLAIAESADNDEAAAAFLLAKRLMAKNGQSLGAMLRPAGEWPHLADEAGRARLVKVLGLTESDKEGESVAAFLMAVRLMKRLGLAFSDIMIAGGGAEADDRTFSEADMRLYRSAEIEMMSLRNRLNRLQGKLAHTDGELKRYRAAFNELMDASWSLHGRDGAAVYS